MIVSESHDAGLTMAFRDIVRPRRGRPHLGPLVVQEGWNHGEGRFSSLLPVRGRPQ
jgi:hypothetical protein